MLEGLRKCSCSRIDCDYFAPGDGEYGTSYSEEELREMYEILKKLFEANSKEGKCIK